ncbi:hypothetical protein [Methanobacterium sp.]|uniref:hypothetical protein n=1 Tax=Methanobacterium sp. TaxID=2164 RepID=UPI003C77F27C
MSSDSIEDNSFDLNFFKNLKNVDGNHGYLICHKCYGYYPLEENELPADFLECECGNSLEFYENIDDFIKVKDFKNSDRNDSEILDTTYNELQEIENVLKRKSEKRKKFLKDLSMRIKVQEDLLTEISYGENRLWDTLDEKGLNNIPENIDANIEVQEDNFLSYVKKQRSRAERVENHYFTKTSAILFVIAVVMLLILYLTT